MVESLGGTVVGNVEEATHIVAHKVIYVDVPKCVYVCMWV